MYVFVQCLSLNFYSSVHSKLYSGKLKHVLSAEVSTMLFFPAPMGITGW